MLLFPNQVGKKPVCVCVYAHARQPGMKLEQCEIPLVTKSLLAIVRRKLYCLDLKITLQLVFRVQPPQLFGGKWKEAEINWNSQQQWEKWEAPLELLCLLFWLMRACETFAELFLMGGGLVCFCFKFEVVPQLVFRASPTPVHPMQPYWAPAFVGP